MTTSLNAMLASVGARLKRHKKHLIYELPNGQNVTVSATSGDSWRGEKNAIRDVRNAAGLVDSAPKASGPTKNVKRERKPGRQDRSAFDVPMSSLSSALAASGVLEARNAELVAEVATLQRSVERLTDRLRVRGEEQARTLALLDRPLVRWAVKLDGWKMRLPRRKEQK